MEPEQTAAASRWFGVRAEYEHVGRLRMAWLIIREFVVGFVSLGTTLGDFDPKRFCDVIVFRRDTGATVATYSYERLGDGTLHLDNLRARLDSTQVYDFCRETGIAWEAVAGPGTAGTELVRWKSTNSRSRRSRVN